MTRRFWIGALLAVPVFLLGMAHLLPNAPTWVVTDPSRRLQFALSTPVVIWAGWPFVGRGWLSVKPRNLNMFTLIATRTRLRDIQIRVPVEGQPYRRIHARSPAAAMTGAGNIEAVTAVTAIRTRICSS